MAKLCYHARRSGALYSNDSSVTAFRFYQIPILVGLWFGLANASAGNDHQAKENQLKQLKSEIQKLEHRLAEQTGQRAEALTALREAELKIGRLIRHIDQLDKDIQTQDRALADLNAEEQQLEKRLAVHRQSLMKQIRAAYRLGNRETLQLLLNQEDPALLGRALTYTEYLNKARLKAIEDVEIIVRELNTLRIQQQQTRDRLAATQENLRQEQTKLEESRVARARLVQSLDQAIQTGGAKLAELQSDRQRLEKLLRELSEILADIPAAPLERQPFKTMRGKLPWPAKGEIINEYNQPLGSGDLRWRGLLIAAPEGNNVRAVFYGQVVFADWLQGLGLILIIDHGGGYLSLYGHNESLLKETGDWVVPGEIIATIGDSGGQNASGVYFEIREQGKPVDPRRWIARTYTFVEAANAYSPPP